VEIKRNRTTEKARQPLTVLMAFIPLATLFAIELYVSNFDGQGAWAAAPLLLVPAIGGLPIALVLLFEVVRAYRSQRALLRNILLVIFALIPVGWLFVRRFLL
jgi:hypothetical protein